MSDVGCRMSDVGCRMSDVRCRMSNFRTVPDHKRSPKGCTALIISVSKAKSWQENAGDARFCIAPPKPFNNSKKHNFETKQIRRNLFGVGKEMLGMV